MEWRQQAFRSNLKAICADTNVGAYAIAPIGDSDYLVLTFDRCELQQFLTFKDAKAYAEFIDMGRRLWYTITEPGGKTPIELLNDAGYDVQMCSDKPNYATVTWGVNIKTSEGDFLCEEALKRFLGKWTKDDVTFIADKFVIVDTDFNLVTTVAQGWKAAMPQAPTTGWKT